MIDYYLITKPGIIFGNLITVFAGFLLASKGNVDFLLFFQTLLGLSLIIASACVFNNYINVKSDRKMERTKNRALVTGKISSTKALIFALILALAGNVVLWEFTNFITLALTNVGFSVYVFIYSFIKDKTIYATALGSISGAIPPVVGYTAVSNHFDTAAFILFFMLVFWQMPHFFSIAIRHIEDYKKANLPLLPILKGVFRTKIHMTIYIVFFMITTSFLSYYGFAGKVFFITSITFGLIWLFLGVKGFFETNDQLWAKKMLQMSLITIFVVSVAIPLDRI